MQFSFKKVDVLYLQDSISNLEGISSLVYESNVS